MREITRPHPETGTPQTDVEAWSWSKSRLHHQCFYVYWTQAEIKDFVCDRNTVCLALVKKLENVFIKLDEDLSHAEKYEKNNKLDAKTKTRDKLNELQSFKSECFYSLYL